MSNINPGWTQEELKIYLLLYSANADLLESEEELDLIRAKTGTSDFEKIHTEFKGDNDFQSIKKIQSATRAHGYTKKDIAGLLSEMKEVFLSDGKYDLLEQNLFRMLKHILN